MRRKFGLAATPVLAIGSIAAAVAGSLGSGSADHRVQVIRLLAKSTEDLNLDLGKHGFSAEDQEVFPPLGDDRVAAHWAFVKGLAAGSSIDFGDRGTRTPRSPENGTATQLASASGPE